jgi:hypothetical protein
MKNVPRFCPYCGADIKKFGHDDNCGRPEDVTLHVKEPGLDMTFGFEQSDFV